MAATSILTNLSRVIVTSATVVPARASSIRFSVLLKVQPSAMLTSSWSLKRNINSQSKLLPKGQYFIEEEGNMEPTYREAMDRWRDDSAKLREMMVLDDILPKDGIDLSEVTENFNYQLKSLIEELIEEDSLDPHVLWSANADY